MNLSDVVGKVKAALTSTSAPVPANLAPGVGPEARRLVEAYAKEVGEKWYDVTVKDFASGRAALEASPETQIAIIHMIYALGGSKDCYRLRPLLSALMIRNQAFSAQDLECLLSSGSTANRYFGMVPTLLRHVKRYATTEGNLTPNMIKALIGLREANAKSYQSTDTRKIATALDELLFGAQSVSRPDPGETWADLALSDLKAMDEAFGQAWGKLLYHAQTADGAKPAKAWTQTASDLVDKLGSDFVSRLPRWFAAVSAPSLVTHENVYNGRTYQYTSPQMSDLNLALLKGLAWCCGGRTEPELARALAKLTEGSLKKIPGTGPWGVRAASAAVWALGEMECSEAVAVLCRLRLKVAHRSVLAQIDKAIEGVASRQGVSRDDLEDLAVPTYGLDAAGIRREEFGEYAAEMKLDSLGSITISWFGPGGKALKSVPAAVKKGFAAELKALKADEDSAQKSLTAQRQRIESFFLKERTWTTAQWRERYFDHPLLGCIVRRLIWKLGDSKHGPVGIWDPGSNAFVDSEGALLEELTDETSIRLWHPIQSSVEHIERWREYLEANEIRQPFKQAHREIYLVTDAEFQTRVYSNRFASHILKQHQMNQLAVQRGWKNKLRLMVDDEYPPAYIDLPNHNLRAEFWIEGVGEEINDTGTYLYLSTDQVRFYTLDSPTSRAHAGGGGYYAGWQQAPLESLQLISVPPLVFSEVMRDVDLFVGVASVGNDPAWADGGPEGHQTYWNDYSFGELNASAKTRGDVLKRLLPRLKIANRCSIDGRFLRVKGDIRTYKIHLGSGNILMEPNDQYLCIVQGRGAASQPANNLFLPFEGDSRMAVILSKAFLLADDKSIKDPTILSQLRR